MPEPQTTAAVSDEKRPVYPVDLFNQAVAESCAAPGIVDNSQQCYRCSTVAWPSWCHIGPRPSYVFPPLPRCWETHNGRPNGKPICHHCVGAAIDGAMSAMRAYFQTPAGQRQLERELQDDESAEAHA